MVMHRISPRRRAALLIAAVLCALALFPHPTLAEAQDNTHLHSASLKVLPRAAVKTAPTSVKLPVTKLTVGVAKTTKLKATVKPAAANQTVRWKSSNNRVFTVNKTTGQIKGVAPGSAILTCYSSVNTKIGRSIPVKVVELRPKKIKLSRKVVGLSVGEEYRVSATVSPATADKTLTWKSADTDIARVSEEGGVTARAVGRTTISATTVNGLKASYTLIVERSYPQGTGAGGVLTAEASNTTAINMGTMKSTLAHISALEKCTLKQIDKLGIRSEEASMRKLIIQRAFKMKAFPWTVSKTVRYWNGEPKHFQPGKLYYGLPYTQRDNRRFNVALAVSGGYYTKNANGYYKMTTKRLAGGYVGNDCSSFAGLAIWGTGHPATFNVTRYMLTSGYYRTITDWKALRAGDSLVYYGSDGGHAVLFLYYTNAAKTRMMIIQQGGGGNTVKTSHKEVEAYQLSGYKIRRRADFKKT